MSVLVFVMGCTGAGKSTFLDALKQRYPNKFGYVEVGKILRAKYPPEYFAGQAAPIHTQKEAWDLCVESVNNQQDKTYIFIDGQPRSNHQFHAIYEDKRLKYSGTDTLFLNCPIEIREARLKEKYKNDLGSLDLAMQRVRNDIISYHSVLMELMKKEEYAEVIDTDKDGWLDKLISYYA